MNSITKSCFPSSYLKVLKESNLTNIELAQKLNMSLRRFKSLIYSGARMDCKEFKDVSKLVNHFKNIKRTSDALS